MKNFPLRFPFRPVEEWKSALMTLPDSGFFELLRSVLGNIKTPFNKQRLLEDLLVLLSREEIRKTIAAYIDKQDHQVIAAIALLHEPEPGELESFFSGEFSFAEIHGLVLNLEERLIVYRFRSGGALRLALNPALEPVLAPFIADTRPLFPSVPGIKRSGAIWGKNPGCALGDDRSFAVLFAFVSGREGLLKNEGGMRKKLLDQGRRIFPGLDLELAAQALRFLGLFHSEGSFLKAQGERIASFTALSHRERQEYWAAAVYLCRQGEEPGLPLSVQPGEFSLVLSRNSLRRAASFIHRFLMLIEPRRRYPEITLRRLAELLGREEGGSLRGYRVKDNRAALPFEPLLDLLEKTGLLEQREGLWESGPAREQTPEAEKSGKQGAPVIAMDTAFSFVLYPEISFADTLALGAFCSVKEYSSSAVGFELTRSSVVRGFDGGLTSQEMLELLDRLSGSRIDANLGWTLKEWENRYAGVSLYQGIVLALAEDRRYLAEAEPVASLIGSVLSPGVYLLSVQDRAEAAVALRKAGVDIIALPPELSAAENQRHGDSETPQNYFSPLESFSHLSLPGYSQGEGEGEEQDAAGEEAAFVKERFRRVLEKTRLSKAERDELAARIERRMILSEAQLEGALVRYEKLEARGLDYVGKSMIAKQAIAAGSLVEVSWPLSGGRTSRTLGIPSALEKKEGETILVLKSLNGRNGEGGLSPDSGEGPNKIKIFRIPLGKISILRRVKQSIFEG